MLVKISDAVDLDLHVSADKPTIVMYSMETCVACKRVKSHMEKLAVEHPEISFVEVDVLKIKHPSTVDVVSLPTIKIFRKGDQVQQLGVLQSFLEFFKSTLNKLLSDID